jgi:hypothetical protein
VEKQYNSGGEENNGMKMQSKGAGSVLDLDGSVDACFVADTIGGPSRRQKGYMLSLSIGVGRSRQDMCQTVAFVCMIWINIKRNGLSATTLKSWQLLTVS